MALLKPVQYKKPSRINTVSISMVLILGVLAYLGWAAYPNAILAGNVKEAMRSKLLRLYQINLQLAVNKTALRDFKVDLFKEIRAVGVDDPEFTLDLTTNTEIVAIEAHFTSVIHFPWLEKQMVWNHTPQVETSAERVDW